MRSEETFFLLRVLIDLLALALATAALSSLMEAMTDSMPLLLFTFGAAAGVSARQVAALNHD